MTRRIDIAALLLLSLSPVGCERCHGHDHPHESDAHGEGSHEHGDDAIGVTRYTDAIELFAEHPPAVAGKPLPFLAHVTILQDFRPLERGTVTLTLEGPERVEARVERALRPGIFQPTLTAPAAGTYRARLVISGPGVEDTVDGFEIVVHANEAAAEAARPHARSAAAPIRFLKEQQWQVPFATTFAIVGSVIPTVEVAGEVTTPPSGQADVGAAIAGRIVALEAGLPRPGQAVRRGDLLATIAPAPASPEDAARADLAVVEAEARLEAARAAVARAERLIADRAISERALEDARRELGVAEKARQTALRARAVFSGAASGRGGGSYRVTAPIDGVVMEVQVTEGKSVTPGELLLRIANLDELWIRARVPEGEASTVRSDHDASFALPGAAIWIPLDVTGDDANASVVDVGRAVDRKSRTVDVIYALRQRDERLRVGARVRVAVPVGEPFRGVVVPRDAVLEEEGRSLIYVQLEGEAFEERVVRLGPRSGALVAIERGLAENERVVTRGAQVVRLSARAGAAPSHGHVH